MSRSHRPVLILGVLVLVLSASAASAGSQNVDETPRVERVGGPTRYATAVAVAEAWNLFYEIVVV